MQKQYRFKTISTMLIILLFTLVGASAVVIPKAEDIQQQIDEAKSEHLVTRVIDGDTVIVDELYTIRLIGIDAPERGKEGYQEAKDYLAEKINNRFVWLELDTSQTDKYDRVLGYIYLEDLMINEQIVAAGLAKATPIAPDTRYASEIKAAQDQAKQAQLGLWSN